MYNVAAREHLIGMQTLVSTGWRHRLSALPALTFSHATDADLIANQYAVIVT
jgi:nitrogen fixation protein